MLYDLEVCCVTSQLRLTQDVGDQDHVTLPLIKCGAAEHFSISVPRVKPPEHGKQFQNSFRSVSPATTAL